MPKNTDIKGIKEKFKPTQKGKEQIKDAIIIIKVIVHLKINDSMIKKVIDQMLWNISGAHGKYLTRYRSEDVISEKSVNLNHEHVFPRKQVIEEIMNNIGQIEDILKNKTVGCVVSTEEHQRLKEVEKENPQLKGWQRYKEARIKVRDMKNDSEFDLNTI
ncbi:hypothetical protein ACFL5P_01165 [candidate division KSB1 bacterium]